MPEVPRSQRLLSTSSSTASLNSTSHFEQAPGGGLPRPATAKTCMTAAMKRWRYLRRLLHYRQMDFEFAFWQMVYLLSNPKVVYKNFTYRKKTKAQFARDDPAFLVLLAGWLVVSSAGFSIVLGIGFFSFLRFLLYVIFVDCIGVGLCIATIIWFVSNKFLIKANNMDSDVEWGYCFDVHLNALFSTIGDPAFCPAVFLHHSHQPTLVHSNSFWKHFMASSNWLLFVYYVPRLSFTTYFGSHQDFLVSICTVGHNIFSKLDSQLEHNAKSHELLPF